VKKIVVWIWSWTVALALVAGWLLGRGETVVGSVAIGVDACCVVSVLIVEMGLRDVSRLTAKDVKRVLGDVDVTRIATMSVLEQYAERASPAPWAMVPSGGEAQLRDGAGRVIARFALDGPDERITRDASLIVRMRNALVENGGAS